MSSASGRWAWRRGSIGSCDPDRIADDAVDARLAGMPTLRMTSQADCAGVPAAPSGTTPAATTRQARGTARDGRASRAPGGAGPQPFGQQQVLLQELVAQKLLRAVYSERQLQEVLADFWFNHFNVFANKGLTRMYLTAYERDAIRPHVLGRFRDLLGATAKSPAMLFYLDNVRSADPAFAAKAKADLDRAAARRPASSVRNSGREITPEMMEQVRQNIPTGINENYARELLELHTLGVDGGYTQQDIVERRARAHRLDHRPAAQRRGRTVLVQPAHARHGRQGRARADDPGRRHRGRRTRAGPAGTPSVHGAAHRDQAGAPFGGRPAAGVAGGACRGDVPIPPTATCARSSG